LESLERLGRVVLTALREGFDVVRHTKSLGVLSLALAVAVWFFVVDVENQTRTDFFPGVVPVEAVNVPEGLAVSSFSEPQVRVRISADKDVWGGISVSDFKATVDLSGMNQREGSVFVRVSVDRGDVDVDEVDPPQVVVDLEPVVDRVVPVRVRLVGTVAQGYSLSESKVSPEEVGVSGPASLVNLVDAVVADVNVTGMKLSLEQAYSLTARDAQGGDINGVNLDQDTAKVSLTIAKQDFTVVYIVNPSLSGNVAAGYVVSAIEVNPAFIAVSGSLEVLQSIDAVTTESISVDGAESDVVRSVRLQLPEGARVGGGGEAVVTVRVVPARGEGVFTVAVKSSGADPNAVVTVLPPTVSVTLAGEMPSLGKLSGEDIGATVNLSGLQAGTQSVAPAINLPAGFQLVKVDPPEVVVTITGP
jgi:YbbR domain-containing protein